MSDAFYMKQAIACANEAFDKGEIPIGCVIVRGGQVIAASHNTREETKNPLDHAEMRAIADASQAISDWRLNECTLYVTVEPCPMCLGALLQARVGRLVYGCADPKRMEKGHFPSLKNTSSVSGNNHTVMIMQGICESECAGLLKRFFGRLA